MSSLEFFHPARTQPFIITFFQVVMAFKRVCKFMRRRTGIVRISISSRKRSNFKHEMRRSQQHLTEVTRGSHVIDSSAVPEYDAERERAADPILSAVAPISFAKVKINPLTKRQKMFQSVARQVAKFNVAQRTKSMTAAERLERALVVKKADDHAQNHASTRSGAVADAGEASNRRSRRSTIRNRSQSVVQLAMKQSDIMATHATEVTKQDAVASAAHRDFMQGITNQLLVSEGAGNADSFDPQNDLEYVSGTAIYYGAVIALQARHGGFLSYNSKEIKASAHKILSNSRFVVKNSEDMTDVGVMKYGDSLWLQAGHSDVLGAQYGTLVDQKRLIQPTLVNCRRNSMFKAQQYGRWIVLNRDDPMGTLGEAVLHEDKVILEQEWFFLASLSPYESSMYKSISNSDEAMTTKIDLFRPGDECTWRVHLVALPSDEKRTERQRQILLQLAKENIDESQAARYRKAPRLLSSLHSDLPMHLTDDAVVKTQLRHKTDPERDQEHLLQLYRSISANGFQSRHNPTKFLGKIYGFGSPIVMYKSAVLHGADFDASKSMFHASVMKHSVEASVDPKEQHEEDYWDAAQNLRVDTRSWSHLQSAMAVYHRRDRERKLRAAVVLQKWVRRFINSTFDYERAMKKVDNSARQKLQEKLILRRKMVLDHVAAIDTMEKKAGIRSSFSEQFAHAHQRAVTAGSMASTAAGSLLHARHRTTKSSISLAKTTPSPSMMVSASSSFHFSSRQTLAPASPAAGEDYAAHGRSNSNSNSLVPGRTRARRGSAGDGASRGNNPLLQMLGADGMKAVFSAAGMEMPDIEEASLDSGGRGGDARGRIFKHTQVAPPHGESEASQAPPAADAPFCPPSPGKRPVLKKGKTISALSLSSLNGSGDGASASGGEDFGARRGSLTSRDAAIAALRGSADSNAAGAARFAPSGAAASTADENDATAPRPYTADAATRHSSATERRRQEFLTQQQLAKQRLCKSASRDFGLPADVFEDAQADVDLKVGLKFLRAMSTRPGIYEDVQAVRAKSSRHRQQKQHHQRPTSSGGGGGGGRPPTSRMRGPSATATAVAARQRRAQSAK